MELLYDLFVWVLRIGLFVGGIYGFIDGIYNGWIDHVFVFFAIAAIGCLVIDILIRIVSELGKWYFERRRLQVIFNSYSTTDTRSESNAPQEEVGRIE
jgi:ABC-type dipeptide/oligopeptide/nickel transport system permease subunit